jgi:hypothetical protein
MSGARRRGEVDGTGEAVVGHRLTVAPGCEGPVRTGSGRAGP